MREGGAPPHASEPPPAPPVPQYTPLLSPMSEAGAVVLDKITQGQAQLDRIAASTITDQQRKKILLKRTAMGAANGALAFLPALARHIFAPKEKLAGSEAVTTGSRVVAGGAAVALGCLVGATQGIILPFTFLGGGVTAFAKTRGKAQALHDRHEAKQQLNDIAKSVREQLYQGGDEKPKLSLKAGLRHNLNALGFGKPTRTINPEVLHDTSFTYNLRALIADVQANPRLAAALKPRHLAKLEKYVNRVDTARASAVFQQQVREIQGALQAEAAHGAY